MTQPTNQEIEQTQQKIQAIESSNLPPELKEEYLAPLLKTLAALESATETGDVAVEGDVAARDIITGAQYNIYVTTYLNAPGPPELDEAAYRQLLAEYLRLVYETHHRLDMQGIEERGGRPVSAELDQVFITLEVWPEREERSQGRLWGGKAAPVEAGESLVGERAEAVASDQLWTLGRRLVVVGGPGCGKTTLLRFMAGQLAAAIGHNRPDQARQALGWPEAVDLPVPIFLTLRDFARFCRREGGLVDPGPGAMLRFIAARVGEDFPSLKLPLDFFERLMFQGRCLIMADGLDEVADAEERRTVREAMQTLVRSYPDNHYVITSRVAAYEGQAVLAEKFRRLDVRPLEPEQVDTLVRRWCQAVYPTPDLAHSQAADLQAAIRANARIRALADTPLIVTILAIVHYNHRQLPGERAALYDRCVEVLLRELLRGGAAGRELRQVGASPEDRRTYLALAAFEIHRRGQAGEGEEPAPTEIERRELVEILTPAFERRSPELGAKAAADFVEAMRVRGGLLAERRLGLYSFSHLSFQEFLAAHHLVKEMDETDRLEFIKRYLAESWWREVWLLAAGYLNNDSLKQSMRFVQQIAGLGDTEASRWRALEVAGQALLEMQAGRVEQAVQRALAEEMAGKLADETVAGITPTLRAALGSTLGALGDPRPGVGLIEPDRALPELLWRQVAEGPFLMGANPDDKDAYDREQPQHQLDLPAFYIARYPLTNAQFAPFVEAGYDERRWWSEAGWAWRNGAEPDLAQIPDEEVRKTYANLLARRPVERRGEPFFWRDKTFNQPNQPVVGLTWYEAMACCAWLERQLAVSRSPFMLVKPGGQIDRAGAATWSELLTGQGYRLRLPTELEWEKAAGWDPVAGRKRIYAWGDAWDPTKTNVKETDLNRTSAVGSFPAGAAPCGALDMTGNVWEWSLSSWGSFDWNKHGFPYPFAGALPQFEPGGREAPDTPGFRTVRGGGWPLSQRSARVSSRLNYHPDIFSFNVGVQLVVVPPILAQGF